MYYLASDHAGYDLKESLKKHLKAKGVEAEDLGPDSNESVDYPDYAHQVASAVGRGEGLGLLVCGTGVGMSMTANRHHGVRAALCGDVYSASMTRQHNDANVLCIGARVVGGGLAAEILKAFLGASFEGGRHERRVKKIEPSNEG